MKRVYDLPLRLFHWVFAALFTGAFLVSKLFDDESPLFNFHMLLGLLLFMLVILRIFWGLVGSTNSRFSSLVLSPKKLINYLAAVPFGKTEKHVGHNPASSWAAVMMIILGLFLALSGLLMRTGAESDFLEESHELGANTFLLVTLAHLAGLLLHHWNHGDGIGMSMLHGKKSGLEADTRESANHGFIALLFILISAGSANYLFQHYDSGSQQLKLPGINLTLGEIEADEETDREGEDGRRQKNKDAAKEDDDHDHEEGDEDDDD